MAQSNGRGLSNSEEKTSLSELSGTSSFFDPLQFEPISSDAESVRRSENLFIETEPVNQTTVKRFDIMDQTDSKKSGSGRIFRLFLACFLRLTDVLPWVYVVQ